MAFTLATLRDRVEAILADSSNAIWSTGDVDEAIRRALHAFSLVSPRHRITTANIAATTREISTASITDAIAVEELWCPYTAGTPEYPPNKLPFRFWREESKLYVQGDYAPAAGTVARIFYSAIHTINTLDSATATTIPDAYASLLATGAAGYAAASRALDLTEQVTVDREATERLDAWAKARLQEFQAGLDELRRTLTLTQEAVEHMNRWAQQKLLAFEAALRTIAVQAQGPGHVPLPALDRHDNTWA